MGGSETFPSTPKNEWSRTHFFSVVVPNRQWKEENLKRRHIQKKNAAVTSICSLDGSSLGNLLFYCAHLDQVTPPVSIGIFIVILVNIFLPGGWLLICYECARPKGTPEQKGTRQWIFFIPLAPPHQSGARRESFWCFDCSFRAGQDSFWAGRA